MATVRVSSLIFPLLLHLFLFHGVSSRSHGSDCPPFSCGQLRKVTFPFRRADDPLHCGDRRFELHCDGNQTTISIASAEYFVTQIGPDNGFFRLVDANFASGRCGLPTQSLSPNSFLDMGFYPISDTMFSFINSHIKFYRFNYPYGTWASFMNCTKPIKDKRQYVDELGYQYVYTYQLVPCLSNNSTFVYVIIAYEGYRLKYLHPSCEFLSMIPAADAPVLGSQIDAFSLLQKGFDCSYSASRKCLKESKRMFFYLIRSKNPIIKISSVILSEMDFTICMIYNLYRKPTIWITVVVVVLLQIALLLTTLFIL